MAAVFYCHSCGSRLSPEETTIAERRGESFTTAACDKCASAGRLLPGDAPTKSAPPITATQRARAINVPQTVAPSAKVTRMPTQRLAPVSGTPTGIPPRQSGRLPAQHPPAATPPVPPRQSGRMASVQAQPEPPEEPAEELAEPAAATPKKSILPLVLMGAGGLVFIAGLVIALSGQPPRKTTESDSPPPPPPPPPVQTTPAETVKAAPKEQPVYMGDFSIDQVEEFVRYKNFLAAYGKISEIEKQVPQDEKFAAFRAKLAVMKVDCQNASRALADETLKTADEKAQAGDKDAVKALFSPQRLGDLLPADAETLSKEGPKFSDIADAAAKVLEQKRQAEEDQVRWAFEKTLPPVNALPPTSNTVLFDQLGLPPKMKFSGGKETWRRPKEKIAYLDGTRRVTIDFNGCAGTVSKEKFIIEYTATTECDGGVNFKIQDWGDRGSNFKYKAGEFQKIELDINDDRKMPRGKRGNASDCIINQMILDFKDVKPGTLAILRISREDLNPARVVDSTVKLLPELADLHGKVSFRPGDVRSLGNWGSASPDDYVSWNCRIPSSGSYEIVLCYSSMRDAEVEVEIAQQKLAAKLPSTGNWGTFSRFCIGALNVPAIGEAVLIVRPKDCQRWPGINLSWVTLTKYK